MKQSGPHLPLPGKETANSACSGPITFNAGVRKKGSKNAPPQRKSTDLSHLELLELKVLIQQSPSVNASRVVSIHDRIMCGEYRIDSLTVAEKILAFEQQLKSDS